MTEIALRYGCNPNQKPARVYVPDGELPFRVLNGAPGYINMMDALNAWQLVSELRAALDLPAAASFKHVSPAGAAVGVPLGEELRRAYLLADSDLTPLAAAYARARGADQMSSFGDFAAMSDTVDIATAKLLRREVSDGVIAPGFEPEALEMLKQKREGKYLVLEIDPQYEAPEIECHDIFGVRLEQRRNDAKIDGALFSDVRTQRREFPAEAIRDLVVATIALKYTQSNSVCFAKDGQVIGIGAGQQSRIHCTRLAGEKADTWWLRQHRRVLGFRFKSTTKRPERINAIVQYLWGEWTPEERDEWEAAFEEVPELLTDDERREWLDKLRGVSLSSDAFFPFSDCIYRAHRGGVEFVAETGGSVRDGDVIRAADKCAMVMAFTGLRLFHH